MCGIVGYFGKRPAQDFLLEGLKRLEYRGYDSAGLAILQDQKSKIKNQKSKQHIIIVRSVGKVANLESKLSKNVGGFIGIAHTRWATHGKPSEKNAHPHTDCGGQVAIVHNGIIENYRELKETLEKRGHRFRSETDTEVIAHLLEDALKKSPFEEAFVKMLKKLKGAYGIVALSADDPDVMLAARLSSPLVLGIGNNEMFIASDASALVGDVKRIVYLDDGEMAVIGIDGYVVKTLKDRKRTKEELALEQDKTIAERNGYAHFMLKEIF